MGSHESYEYFRSYYVGETDTLEESLEDLKHIASGIVLDLSFVLELLETSNDERRTMEEDWTALGHCLKSSFVSITLR